MFGIVSDIIRRIGSWISQKVRKVINAIRPFFANIISWTCRAYQQLESKIGRAIDVTQFFLKKTFGGIKRISYNYNKTSGNQWEKYEVESRQNVPEEEIPLEYIQKAKELKEGGMFDITDSTRRELSLVS